MAKIKTKLKATTDAIKALKRMISYEQHLDNIKLTTICFEIADANGAAYNLKGRELVMDQCGSIIAARRAIHCNNNIHGVDAPSLPPAEYKTSSKKHCRLTDSTSIATVCRAQDYRNNDSELFKIYGQNSNVDIICGMFINGKLERAIVIPSIAFIAKGNIWRKITEKGILYRNNLITRGSGGRDDVPIKWVDIKNDPLVKIINIV